VTDLIDVASLVIAALEQAGVRYTVGGSLASSFSGEPRSSIDADILVEMASPDIPRFLGALGASFYADADALQRAVVTRTSMNLIHHASGIKVDLFIAGSFLDGRQLERRRRVQVTTNPDRFWFVHAPEDILLQKLVWYRRGGEVSERQWRDALAIVTRQGRHLDRPYLTATAAVVGVSDLLDRVCREAGSPS